jgi:tetratricopeptide (TPR) repeat protein
MADPLRAYWDFDDLDGSERRLDDALAKEPDERKRAEILTQLARVEGLRGNFDEGERLIGEAETLAGESPTAWARIDLERGRLRRSGGDTKAALPLFESAFARAEEAGQHFLAADAAHMAALAAPDRDGLVAWTKRGIALAEAEPTARYWLGPLLNNLGWERYEAGEYELALVAFERALEERERDPANADGIELARYAVAKTLRALGRVAEGVALAEQAVASAEADGRPDGWYHEELAETYAALGRNDDAATQAERALALLPEADPDFERDSERSQRLRALAASRDRAQRP